MKKGLLLGFLIIGIAVIAALVVLELILAVPIASEQQVPSLRINYSTETLIVPIEPETNFPVADNQTTDIALTDISLGQTQTMELRIICYIDHLDPQMACTPLSSDEQYYCPPPCDCPGGCGTVCGILASGDRLRFGHVPVKICYPGNDLHEMTVYFMNTETKQLLEFPISGDKPDYLAYSFYVPSGDYVVFAWGRNTRYWREIYRSSLL